MTTLEKTLPPVQALTLERVYIEEARIRAVDLSHEAELAKSRSVNFTTHHLESPLSDKAKYRLGGTGLKLSVSSRTEFAIPTDEN